MEKLNLPVKASVVGEVVMTKAITSGVRNMSILVVQDANGVNNNVWFSDGQLREFGLNNILFLGNIVSVDVEQCIADTTQYLDDAGNVEFHTVDHIRGLDATNAGRMVVTKLGFTPEFYSELEVKRTSVSGERSRSQVKVLVSKSHATREELEEQIVNLKRKLAVAPEVYKEVYQTRINMIELNIQEMLDDNGNETSTEN